MCTSTQEGTTNRPQWVPTVSTARPITNAADAAFHITASGTVRGFFLLSDTLVLWSEAAATQAVLGGMC